MCLTSLSGQGVIVYEGCALLQLNRMPLQVTVDGRNEWVKGKRLISATRSCGQTGPALRSRTISQSAFGLMYLYVR